MSPLFEKLKSLFTRSIGHSADIVKAGKSPKRTRKVKRNTDKELQTIEQMKLIVSRNGYCSIKVKSLFQLYGYKQRGHSNVLQVRECLEREGLFLCRKAMTDTNWNKNVRIHSFPVERLGDIFNMEKEMEDAFAINHWYKLLGLEMCLPVDGTDHMSDRQFKPDGTKDRLDFKATDKEGNHVVVELKHKDGDNRLVEQALRYRTHLMNHYNTDRVRCVIITGIRCLHTAKALYALPLQERELIRWYVYNWDILRPADISFVEVTYDFIAKHLTMDSNC
ncbi:DUF91 domain-containing protein [Pontibacter sp. JH31]|uniref:DUF91 domain-containing protein n=1 Tax=Pontibacter aquaedesilientis TaxID=2766980 RepID=A0ABR7XKM8_9BACT|nr:endonuclease NucS domain-containing protein [Pontibacter aquaedesilientis]MBD1398829.1 DUF91 domain-containing protein [Pontibacter aquaedesilientis]